MIRPLLAALLLGCSTRTEPPPPAPPPDPAEQRPQTPDRDAWTARDLTVTTTDGLTLAGTLTLPSGEGPFPAALLLADSGPNDRTGDVVAHRPLSVWADHLAHAGIASLALDDRGVGKSGGSLTDTTVDQLAADADSARQALAALAEIDPSKVGFLGHGEGGVVASKAAVDREDVAFLVLLSTPGETGREVLLDQAEALLIAAGAPDHRAATHRGAHAEALEALATNQDVRSAFKKLISIQLTIAEEHLGAERPVDMMQVVDGAVATVSTPLFTSLLDNDPAADVARATAPVLAIGGSLDLQVLPDANLDALRTALDGHEDATVLAWPGLNHLLQPAERGTPSEYGMIDTTVAPEVLEKVTGWVAERTANAEVP